MKFLARYGAMQKQHSVSAKSLAQVLLSWLAGDSSAAKKLCPNSESLHSFDLIASYLIKDQAICVVDTAPSNLYINACLVAKEARSVDHDDNFQTVVLRYQDDPNGQTVLILNIDIMESIDDAVEELLAAKHLLPNATFVICSRYFSANDFTRHRVSIADASLRLPCSAATLAIAIESAIRNRRSADQPCHLA